MKRRRLIICTALAVIIAGVIVRAKTRPPADLTRVTMGFVGIEMVKGKRVAVFSVTNGSDVKIIHPIIECLGGDPTELGATGTLAFGTEIYLVQDPGIVAPGWSQILPPAALGIPPGAVYRTQKEIPDGFDTVLFKAYFQTIPFKYRLPPVLQNWWPSGGDGPENFSLQPSRIDLVRGRSVDNLPSKWERNTITIQD